MRTLSWEPEQNGDRYCSLACGRGCTTVEHDRAEEIAGTLSIRLGIGWRGEVWENLGWHTKAVSTCGRIKVHPPHVGGLLFTAYLGEAESAGGRWSASGVTPELAIKRVIAAARAEIRRTAALVKGLVAQTPCEHCEAPDLHEESS